MFPPSDRTRVRRLANRGVYGRQEIYAILDEATICHAGFVSDGQPYVIPTAYARVDDRLYLHGAGTGRLMRALAAGEPVCITVTLVDGLVLARSAFHHSLNYRSVVALGKARPVTDPREKMEALRRFTEHLVPGRWEEVREPNEQELNATSVVALDLNEVSAKVRTGPPVDDGGDYALPVWAGVVPVHSACGEPVADGRVPEGVTPFDAARLGSAWRAAAGPRPQESD